jgi:AraC-like DNA-binding protein
MPEPVAASDVILPAMAAKFLTAVIDRACLSGASRDGILAGTLLRAQVLEDDNRQIPSYCAYEAAENATRLSGNPFLCAEVSQEFDWFSGLRLPLFASKHPSLGDLLVAWLKHIGRDQHSSRYQMIIDIETAIIRGWKLHPSVRPTAQADAWDIAAWIKAFRERLDRHWDNTQISIRISDPAVIPSTMLHPDSVRKSDKGETEIRFPSDWLLAATSALRDPNPSHVEADGAVEDLGAIFETFDYSDFPAFDDFAKFFGYQPKTLQRRLAGRGTSFSELVDRGRRAQAITLLQLGELQILDIADALGYRNASAFNRAFSRWLGRSPRRWQAENQA